MISGPSHILGSRNVKRRERKRQNWDVDNLYGWNKSQYLPSRDFHEIENTKKINERNLVKSVLRSPDNKKCGHLLECHSEHASNKLGKANYFPISSEKKQLN